ncbi:hypothetical protein [Methylobacterium planeticum]|uniref:Uncharacterized protein n=1 Tax=Methylobacterium planeticum TaxID=2615211 RepID=A0A6N6MP05_9HYPH|nr:hypothetical protein [Methylobacterium planeticum]KAB1071644.1 hypothetical protein F6X51_18960 [Methylobacterium planeticum]
MKSLAAALAGAMLVSTACFAQTAPPSPPPGPPASGPSDGTRPDGPRRGPPDGEREGGWRHRPPMLGMKGGHLRFRRGETGIDFKCAADDTTKACVDALMPLVDKLLQGR